MKFTTSITGKKDAVIDLFSSVFAASETPEEGLVIAGFVTELIDTTPKQDLFCYLAEEDAALKGGVFFSRLNYPQSDKTVFILSPMAVKTSEQGLGIGQELITHALNDLRSKNIDTVITYGDPNYYSKTGFEPITEIMALAPFPLQQPEGWLGQSLKNEKFEPLLGKPTCVKALNNPDLW